MKVSVIGTGYVGLVTGACLAEVGHEVVCVDVDRGKVERINPTTDPGSRAITLYISVRNRDLALRGGMFAKGQIVVDRTTPSTVIPASAVAASVGWWARRSEAYSQLVELMRSSVLGATSTACRNAAAAGPNSPRK